MTVNTGDLITLVSIRATPKGVRHRARYPVLLAALILAGCGSGTSDETLDAATDAVNEVNNPISNATINPTNSTEDTATDTTANTTTDTTADTAIDTAANSTADTNTDSAVDTNTDNTADNEVVPVATRPTVPTEPAISVGSVHTVEVNGVVFTSLPDTVVNRTTPSQELGRLLFWDPVLSGEMDTACATCHLPELGYADNRARSAGTSGVGTGAARVPGEIGQVPRNAQTVLNTVWNGINEFGVFDTETAPMFWDNRIQSLARQAIEPIHSREEMRGDNFTVEEIDVEVVSRLESISEYTTLFSEAFGTTNVSLELIGQALADFQSTLVANNSPFDRWVRGDATAMSPQQRNGMAEFAQVGCAECHSGPLFSDFEPHVLGVPEAQGLAEPDAGNGNFAFRTPTLRQLAFTGPYFHGGQESELDDVIDFYDNPGNSNNPNVPTNRLDPDFRNLPNINNNRRNAIEAFLNALNDNGFDRTRPATVPSGLPVGGSL